MCKKKLALFKPCNKRSCKVKRSFLPQSTTVGQNKYSFVKIEAMANVVSMQEYQVVYNS